MWLKIFRSSLATYVAATPTRFIETASLPPTVSGKHPLAPHVALTQ